MESAEDSAYPAQLVAWILNTPEESPAVSGERPATGSGELASFRAPGLVVCPADDLPLCAAISAGCPAVTLLGLSPSALEKAAAAIPGARAQLGAWERTGLPGDSVSILILSEAALLKLDLVRLSAEFRRILRPEGAVVVLSEQLDGEGWAATVRELLEPHGREAPLFPPSELEPAGECSVTVSQRGSLPVLLDFARRSGGYLLAGAAARRELLTRVQALHEYGSLAGAEEFSMTTRIRARLWRVPRPVQ
ncbi:MAG: hypothetical protein LKF88_01775 [Microbacteriaceae bacterium]|jgi:hypothetical protein|nr:hypothetical protein [Microbacteriaceae bacterium]MCI1207629.1 hypothetical protein [Microbacteriaceae bacterium]